MNASGNAFHIPCDRRRRHIIWSAVQTRFQHSGLSLMRSLWLFAGSCARALGETRGKVCGGIVGEARRQHGREGITLFFVEASLLTAVTELQIYNFGCQPSHHVVNCLLFREVLIRGKLCIMTTVAAGNSSATAQPGVTANIFQHSAFCGQ